LLRNWRSLCPFQVGKKSQLNILWSTLPKFILWKIWLERNNRLFREITCSSAQVASKIKSLFGESAPYFSKVKNSRGLEAEEEQWIKSFNLKEQPEKTSIETKHENWEIRLKEEEFGEWKRQRKKHLLFFDGASKGNPGATGGGGVLLAPDGKLELSYAWGLGEDSNNRAEALALWQGLNQAISKKVNDLVIIGDSRLIIQALILHNPVKQTKLQHILEKIHHLLKRLRAFQLFHILCNLNEQADEEANIGVTLSKGEIQINGISSHLEIP
jgi:ribonuclease HI